MQCELIIQCLSLQLKVDQVKHFICQDSVKLELILLVVQEQYDFVVHDPLAIQLAHQVIHTLVIILLLLCHLALIKLELPTLHIVVQ